MPKVLIFDVADTALALPVDVIREILPLPLLSRPPQMPSLIEGVFNLRGQAASVLRLDRLLGLAGAGTAGDASAGVYAPLLLLKPGAMGTGAGPLALLVDRVRGIQSVAEAALLPVSALDSLNGCVAAELAGTEPPAHLLSLDRLLLERERRCILEHQARAERRLAELGEAP